MDEDTFAVFYRRYVETCGEEGIEPLSEDDLTTLIAELVSPRQ